MIKAIIFDCFGVLTADSWHEFRQSLPKDQQPDASDLNRQYCSGQLSREDFLAFVADLTGEPEDSIARIIDKKSSKNTRLLGRIKDLKSSYEIGLLSNVASSWITDNFLTPEEQALFDEFVFSYQVKMTKPDPRIYRLICERLGANASEAVMVDDIDRYCKAAKTQGMEAIVYRDFPQFNRELEMILSGQSKTS